ncbi:MAG: hypothetical protein HY909_20210 [Deltaproteobacteria bacterium]|nr:hypothetical protein [Deltaproteobacteria bacterium]
MKTLTISLALASMVFSALPAHADARREARWHLRVGADTDWQLDRGHDALTRNGGAWASAYLALGRTLATFGERWSLAGEVFYRGSGRQAVLYQALDTRFASNALGVGAQLRYALAPWLQPYGGLQVAALRTDLTVTDRGTMESLESGAWSPLAMVSVGALLQTPPLARGSRVRLGLTVEAVFRLGLPVGYDLRPETPSDETLANDRLPVQAVALGDLAPVGPTLRVAGVLRW